MKDFKKAHSNMVFGQLLPNKLVDQRLRHALTEVWREEFVPDATRPLSYGDQGISLGETREALSSLSLMRLLQGAGVTKKDRVLDVAAGTGYGAVVLSYLAKKVVCVEADQGLCGLLEANLEAAAVRNVSMVRGPLAKGAPKQGPYEVILVEGAMQDVPFSLLNQLAEGGRLLTYEPLFGDENRRLSRAVCYERVGKTYTKTTLFEANAPRLRVFDSPQGFEL